MRRVFLSLLLLLASPSLPLAAEASPRDGAIPSGQVAGPGQGVTTWAMGVKVTIKLFGQDSGGAYAVFEDEVPPGVGTPLHLHTREEEMWRMLEGELTWVVGDRTWIAKAGDFVNTPRGVPHRFLNHGNATARMLLAYAPAGFEEWFLQVGTPDTGSAPAKPDREAMQRAMELAHGYGVEFLPPAPQP